MHNKWAFIASIVIIISVLSGCEAKPMNLVLPPVGSSVSPVTSDSAKTGWAIFTDGNHLINGLSVTRNQAG